MKKPQPHWIYDGNPEDLGMHVGETHPTEGGYVMAIFTHGSAELQLAATRHPAKYLTQWRWNGRGELHRILVAGPYLRYEAVKRRMAQALKALNEMEDADRVLQAAEDVLDAASV